MRIMSQRLEKQVKVSVIGEKRAGFDNDKMREADSLRNQMDENISKALRCDDYLNNKLCFEDHSTCSFLSFNFENSKQPHTRDTLANSSIVQCREVCEKSVQETGFNGDCSVQHVSADKQCAAQMLVKNSNILMLE